MIDRKTFIEFWKKRNNRKTAFLFLVVYVSGIIFCFLPATKRMNEHPLYALAWFVLFFTYLIGMPFLWSRIVHGKADPRFLKCPVCKKRLGRVNQRVIATGKCGHCGARILTDFEKRATPDSP